MFSQVPTDKNNNPQGGFLAAKSSQPGQMSALSTQKADLAKDFEPAQKKQNFGQEEAKVSFG